jgi:hypothetical protein
LHNLIFLYSPSCLPLSNAYKPTSCINIAERDLQMQDRSAFKPKNNISSEVYRKLAPDVNFLSCPKFFIGHPVPLFLDSRLMTAGMTDLKKSVYATFR